MTAGEHLQRGHWQAGFAYRHLTANQWFVGRQVREDAAPFRKPLLLDINSLDLVAGYGVSDSTRIALTVPFSRGTHSRLYADNQRHKVAAEGLGDITVGMTHWIRDGSRAPMTWNIELGAGIKTATGRNDVMDDYFLATGKTRFTVDQSIQLGDGGWGVVIDGQAFRVITAHTHVYVSGSYLVSPRNQSSVHQALAGPYATVQVSIPDVYNARGGLTYAVPGVGATFTLGGRIDGIASRDLIGKSDGFRRPAIIGYVEPGLTLSRGADAVSLSVPVRAYVDFRSTVLDRTLRFKGGGDLARKLLFASYLHRF